MPSALGDAARGDKPRRLWHSAAMRRLLLAAPLLLIAAADVPAVLPGKWEVKSVPVELKVPGVPGFLLSMARKTRTDHKCIGTEQARQGIVSLIQPKDAKTCTLESRDVGAGTFRQTYLCRQKDGRPIRAVTTGRYDQATFSSHSEMTGDTKKGPLRIVFDQTGRRAAATCKG